MRILAFILVLLTSAHARADSVTITASITFANPVTAEQSPTAGQSQVDGEKVIIE